MLGVALALAVLGNLAFLAHANRQWGLASRDVPRVRALRVMVAIAAALAGVACLGGPGAWPVAIAAVTAGLAVHADPVPRAVALWAGWVLVTAVAAGIGDHGGPVLLLLGAIGVGAPLVTAGTDGPALWRMRAAPLPRATLRR